MANHLFWWRSWLLSNVIDLDICASGEDRNLKNFEFTPNDRIGKEITEYCNRLEIGGSIFLPLERSS